MTLDDLLLQVDATKPPRWRLVLEDEARGGFRVRLRDHVDTVQTSHWGATRVAAVQALLAALAKRPIPALLRASVRTTVPDHKPVPVHISHGKVTGSSAECARCGEALSFVGTGKLAGTWRHLPRVVIR